MHCSLCKLPGQKAAIEVWTAGNKHPKVAKLLAIDDVLIDTMRGRSSTWTRIRVNLRNVPEELRPRQSRGSDDDPTRSGGMESKGAEEVDGAVFGLGTLASFR